LRRKLLKKGYPSRVADNVSETRCEKHGADAPPVNERDVLTINDQAIELVKEDLETHTGLFVESLEVYSIKVISAFEDDRPIVGDMNAAEAGE
jgi:hypothetical protein